MKKIVISFFLFLLLTSCFNKQVENNNLSIIDKKIKNTNSWTIYKENKKVKLEFNEKLISDNKISSKYWIVFYSDDYTNISWFSWDLTMCDNNNLIICDLIKKNYFYNIYYNKCISINDISKCDFLSWEDKAYCKWNYYINKLIDTKDKTVCNNFKDDFSYWYLMSSEKINNKDLCIKFYNDILSKGNFTESDIEIFSKEVSNDLSLPMQLKSILLSDLTNNVNNFIDLLEIKTKKWILNCEKLKDKNYIFWILNWIKTIFKDKESAKDAYNKLLWTSK